MLTAAYDYVAMDSGSGVLARVCSMRDIYFSEKGGIFSGVLVCIGVR